MTETNVAIKACLRTLESMVIGKMSAERRKAAVTIVTFVQMILPMASVGAERPEAMAAVSISSGSIPARTTPSTRALTPRARARSLAPSRNQSAPCTRSRVPTASSPRAIKRGSITCPFPAPKKVLAPCHPQLVPAGVHLSVPEDALPARTRGEAAPENVNCGCQVGTIAAQNPASGSLENWHLKHDMPCMLVLSYVLGSHSSQKWDGKNLRGHSRLFS